MLVTLMVLAIVGFLLGWGTTEGCLGVGIGAVLLFVGFGYLGVSGGGDGAVLLLTGGGFTILGFVIGCNRHL